MIYLYKERRPWSETVWIETPVDKLLRRLLRKLEILGMCTDTFRSYDGYDGYDGYSLVALCRDMRKLM